MSQLIVNEKYKNKMIETEWNEEDECILSRGVDQLELLDRQLKSLEYRLRNAEEHGQNSYSYQLQLRINGIRYARTMFYEFCQRKANKLIQLQELKDEQKQMKKEKLIEEWKVQYPIWWFFYKTVTIEDLRLYLG